MTTHELARQLLATPDLPVFHYDPSLPTEEERLTEPCVESYQPDRWRSRWKPFAIVRSVSNPGAEWLRICDDRTDSRRLQWVLDVLAKEGTNGLNRRLFWEPPGPPQREDIDAAMEREPKP